jgi:hypothetical protein
MNALVATLQAVPGALGTALMIQIFRMWRRGDLVPKAVLELMEAARKEEQAQKQILMTAVIEALGRSDTPPRHSRDN